MRVGLFDSGIGGLTILNSIVKMVNHTEFFYVADTLYTPYGEKDKSIILKRCDDITNYLLDNYKIDILVIACNTATSVAIKHLREKFKDLPIIGVEPALKPAINFSKNSNIAIMGTPSTINGEKYKELVANLTKDKKLNLYHIPCSGLAKEIEDGEVNNPRTKEMLKLYLEPLKDKNIDSLVLGCTHYPIIKDEISSFFNNNITLFDSANAVAKRLFELSLLKDYGRHSSNITILYSSKINFDKVKFILKDSKYELSECKIWVKI